jgi:hypothetical protein
MSEQETKHRAPVSEGEALTLTRLIEQQQVSPANDLDEISDLWPGDDDPNLLMDYILNERFQRRTLNKRERLPDERSST